MTPRSRELETLLLSMFAAVPLYFTAAIGKLPVLLFHAAMAVIVVRVALGRSPELVPARLFRWLAIAYVPFYIIDWRFLGGSAIAASTHLVLFIAVYQPSESLQRNNHAQRMLTTALIFVASIATSTHITIMPFVVVFAFLTFRQLMYVSHLETVRALGREYAEPPSARAATFYLAGAMLIGALLFPLLPRVRNPFMHGVMGSLPGSSTALSDSIDFSEARVTATDATVVTRVWMDRSVEPFFAPVRLRGMIYDRFAHGRWQQSLRGLREVRTIGGAATVARAGGVEGVVIVQQRAQRGKLFLPVDTVSVSGLSGRLYEGPSRETYYTYNDAPLNLTVRLATRAEPLRLQRVSTLKYPLTPEVVALARRIAGNERDPQRQAARVESYLLRNYRYVPNPADLTAKRISVEDFLLRNRSGHCEYFAAGMVVLMTALDVPARIAGGFYGGRLNRLTGYYTIRREDAHAWTEVWNGSRWVTFDATPPALRPGAQRASAFREYFVALADSANFIWDRYILTFGLGDQITLAEDLIALARETAVALRDEIADEFRAIRTRSFVSTLLLVIALGAAAIALRNRRRPLFDVLAKHLAARGIEVGPSMTMEEALRELRTLHPDAARELEPLIALYEEERFSPRADKQRGTIIRRRLRELRA